MNDIGSKIRTRGNAPRRKGVPVASLLVLTVLAVLALAAGPALAGETARQDLRIALDPKTGGIEGQSVIRLPAGLAEMPDIRLHPGLTVRSVSVDGRAAPFRFQGGRLLLDRVPSTGAGAAITVEYGGAFPEPVPTPEFGSDNPGFGVGASITPQGVFLQGGSGWHPRLPGLEQTVRLEVDAPRGFLAVTAGRLLGHEDQGGRTVSRWESRPGPRGLPLSAGPYIQERLETGRVPVMTYFFPDNAALADTYLRASARHLATYEALLGPYPFDHFAVVENFFPTGYGMPSYTLLGTSVLRLPFIPETSLRHEVVHCWWGNGVLVEYSGGNWSEGLTTYLADHMAQEENSPEAAREYRLRALRDYAQLAAGPRDFPLGRFLSRTDPATQAVGYGKAMFVAHMLRQRLGDKAFTEGLRAFYRQWLFREAAWGDLLEAFAGPGWDAQERDAFLRQWILEPGAPDLVLEDAEVRPLGDGWEVDGVLRQRGRTYALRVPVRLETEEGPLEMLVPLDGPETHFTMASPHRPVRLTADPDVHLFRLLAPEEIPPTVNAVKGARNLTVVVGEGMSAVSRRTIEGFLGSLNQPRAKILDERQAQAAELAGADVLFFGYPRRPDLQKLLVPPASYGLTPGGRWFSSPDHPGADEVDAVFLTMPGASGGQGVTALFDTLPGLDEAAVVDAARRITHYGKESYLGFARGRNLLRGAWPPVHSPLTAELTP